MSVLSKAAYQALVTTFRAKVDAYLYDNITHDITGAKTNELGNDIADLLNDLSDSYLNITDSPDSFLYRGAIDCSTNPNYPAADAGHVYIVSVAGKIGGASGIDVEAGDMIVCKTDGTIAGTQAAVGAQWDAIQGNLTPLGYTPENVANKDTDITLGANSDIKYPSQKAVRAFVEGIVDGKMPMPVSDTVANTQAAAIALEFIVGQERIITNPYGSANNEFRTITKSTSTLEPTGHGTFRNAVMSSSIECVMGYDLTSDFINLVHDTAKNNYCVQRSGASIDKYRLDSSNFFGNTLVDLVGTWSATNVRMTDCSFPAGGTLNMSGEAVLLDNLRCTGAVTAQFVSDTANYIAINIVGIDWGVWIGNTSFGINSSVTGYACLLLNCTIGEGRTLATGDINPGYEANGKTYISGFSNFEMTGTFRSQLNPDGSGIITVANCEWIGKVIITDTSASTSVITFNGFSTDHDYIIEMADAIGTDCVFHDQSDSGDNIFLEAATFTLRDSWGDSLTLGAHSKNPSVYARQVTSMKPLTQAI